MVKPSELICYRAKAPNILAIAGFPSAIGRSLPKLRPVSAQWVLKHSTQAGCRNVSRDATPTASQSGKAIRIRETAAWLAPAIVWLAPAIKVERPFALRLHLIPFTKLFIADRRRLRKSATGRR